MTIDEEHKDFFGMVCEPKLDGLEAGQARIIDILKGKNGEAGLCDDVRNIKKTHRLLTVGIAFVLSILTIEGASWLFTIIKGAYE